MRDYDPEDSGDGPPGEDADEVEADEVDADEVDADEVDADEPGEFYLSDDDEFDDLTMEGLFLPVTSLWQVIGAIDEDERLTPLGWWGLPEAMLRVWAPSGGGPSLTWSSARRWARARIAEARQSP